MRNSDVIFLVRLLTYDSMGEHNNLVKQLC